MATALEVAAVASDMLMWAFSVVAIAFLVLVVWGKLKVPTRPLRRRWQVVACSILAMLLLAGSMLP